MGASMSIEGSADGEAFLLYVERLLCPTLERGQVVVMDNQQVHQMKRVRDLIEEACSKVKTLLRKAKARSFEALVQATGGVLSAVSKEDARGFFAHSGSGKSRALSL